MKTVLEERLTEAIPTAIRLVGVPIIIKDRRYVRAANSLFDDIKNYGDDNGVVMSWNDVDRVARKVIAILREEKI